MTKSFGNRDSSRPAKSQAFTKPCQQMQRAIHGNAECNGCGDHRADVHFQPEPRDGSEHGTDRQHVGQHGNQASPKAAEHDRDDQTDHREGQQKTLDQAGQDSLLRSQEQRHHARHNVVPSGNILHFFADDVVDRPRHRVEVDISHDVDLRGNAPELVILLAQTVIAWHESVCVFCRQRNEVPS